MAKKQLNDYYIYPAVFYYADGEKIGVLFPDFPGCGTCADTEEKAYKNAKEALAGHILAMEEDGDPVPAPTPLCDVKPEYDDASYTRTVLVEVYMVNYRDAWENRVVNKTVTVPRWLNRIAEDLGINFSQTLQEALKIKVKRDGKFRRPLIARQKTKVK